MLYNKYSDGFDLDDPEVVKPKELTPAMVRDNPQQAQSKEANVFLTKLMEREDSLNSLIDSYDRQGKSVTQKPK